MTGDHVPFHSAVRQAASDLDVSLVLGGSDSERTSVSSLAVLIQPLGVHVPLVR